MVVNIFKSTAKLKYVKAAVINQNFLFKSVLTEIYAEIQCCLLFHKGRETWYVTLR